MHWRHRFPMLFIVVGHPGIGKRRTDTDPKDVLSDSGLRSSWPSHSFQNRDPPDTPQQSQLGEVALSSIRMKSLPHSSSVWADIWIKDLIPISKTSYVPPWNTCRSVWPPSEIPAQTRIPPPC
ncbi:hypothetical protein TNCV_3948841 [Trichonephila clavipes]|nr:hypothetical protein TNCV_3948841 [Trichonephila clavipes]